MDQERALERLRVALTSAPENAYFDSTKITEVYTDASPVGVAAVLTQKEPDDDERKVIAFASRAMSSPEQNYSQLEREALAIVWACEHFHLYLYGGRFTVFTRITNRWLRYLLIRHRNRQPGSRNGLYDYNLTTSPFAISPEQNVTLQAVITAVQIGKWYDISKDPRVNTSDFQSFEKVKEKLCTLTDLVLRGHGIVVHETLREKVVDITQEGHMGMTKTKALVREKVWFPKIDRMVEEKVKSCLACQVTTPTNEREPLQMSELPTAPWTEVSINFGVAPTGSSEYLLILIDDYSRFPAVELVGLMIFRNTWVSLTGRLHPTGPAPMEKWRDLCGQ